MQIDIKGRPPTGGASRKFATLRYSEQDHAWFADWQVRAVTERSLGGIVGRKVSEMKAKGWT